jgi:methylated-DNA-[protein]-cysteine S-methyltransferase
MTAAAYALFDTAIGACGVAWAERGVVATQLPEVSRKVARTRLRRRFPEASERTPPPAVARAIAAIVALLDGEARDLGEIVLDFEGVGDFERRVYEASRAIGPGETATYGEIAGRVGEAGGARAVGQAMGRNPFPIIVPCHRVLGADGKLGGFSAHGGAATKARLLTIERARVGAAPALFDDLPIAVAPARGG